MITRRLALSVLLLSAAACASGPGPAEEGEGDERVVEDYQLGAGDRVRVTVFAEPSLTGEFQVSSGGMISMPLVGDLPASGLTVAAFQRSVETALRNGYLLDPRVSAEVLTYRPFYILGEVGNPGTYPYSAGLTVLNAVATAGGFTYRANTGRVYIRRASASTEEVYQLSSRTRVAPGDTIRIGERLF
jgi:protein involved in polysaccharide export with SLBB domain